MGWIGRNDYLDQWEMENNALIIAPYMQRRGWTLNAIAAMLGNMQAESTINPWIWENLEPFNPDLGGFGLVQWTKWTKYADWAGEGWETSTYKQLDRILWELDNDEQWIETSRFPETFFEFSRSAESPYYLGGVWVANYERPGSLDLDYRGRLSEKWYKFLTDKPPVTRGIPIWLMYKLSRRI